MKKCNKILIFRLSSIGDIILTSTLVRCLRTQFPEAQIDFVVKRQFSLLLTLMPEISKVHSFDSEEGLQGLLKLRRKLSKEKYDVMLDIHRNWRSACIRRTIGASRVYCYNKHVLKRFFMIRFKIDAYHIVRPVYLRFLDAAKKLGVQYDSKPTELIIPKDVQKKVDNYIEDAGLKPHKNLIVLCPGASFSNKEWQSEKFQELAQRIIHERKMQVILLGGSKEKATCEQIASVVQGPILNVAGAFNLAESAALLNRAQATVSNDTGMLHLSEALNVPVVGIYGPTVRQFGYFPILPKSKVAQVEIACRPCTKMGMNYCPKNTFDCTQKISVDSVFELLETILPAK